MGYKKMFNDLIEEGFKTKAYLTGKLNAIKSYGLLTDAEYNEILTLINSSSLPNE